MLYVTKFSMKVARDFIASTLLYLLNAMFGIFCSGVASSLKEAQAMARESIDSGAARQKLAQFVDWSNKLEHGGAP